MPDMNDRLNARAYRQAATMYARWRASGPASMEQHGAIFAQMQVEDDWIRLVFALTDIGFTLRGLSRVEATAYLDGVIRDAMTIEETGEG